MRQPANPFHFLHAFAVKNKEKLYVIVKMPCAQIQRYIFQHVFQQALRPDHAYAGRVFHIGKYGRVFDESVFFGNVFGHV